MAKGQVEFVVIIGIVIVASVVILYAYQSGTFAPSPVPPGIKAKYDSVKTSMESLVRDGSQETMRKLSLYGGYLDNSSFPMGSVTFLGKQVPYWQYNGRVQPADIKANFAKGLKSYLSDNKDGMLQAMNIGGVTLGDPQVTTNFLPGKITVTVNMATEIDGQTLSQPYVVDVQTQMQEIDEFSRGFAQYDSDQRPFEYYTLSSMLMTPIVDDIHTVPLFVFLNDCGQFAFKNWWDVKPPMETVIKQTLANTFMPGKQMTHPDEIKTQYTLQEFQSLSRCTTQICTDSAWLVKGTPFISSQLLSPQYSIVPLNGKSYDTLDVTFHLPDDFQLSQANFQFSPDPIVAIPKVIPLVGQCQSDPIYVNYFVTYPVIVRVKDPQTQNVFQFALNVYLKDNKPGEWASASGYQNDIQKQICSNPRCTADIALVSSSGKPVDSASISFMGCELGTTDSQGALKATAPCGIGPLQVYKNGYESYSVMQSSDNLTKLRVSVVKTPSIRLHFYEVAVQNLSLSGKYQILKDSVSALNGDHVVYVSFYDYARNKITERGFNSAGGLISTMPAGNYVIGATLLSKADELGGIIMGYPLSEDLDGKDLYVYLPSTLDYSSITDTSQKGGATAALTGVLAKCGLGPISASEIKNFDGCSVGYNEV